MYAFPTIVSTTITTPIVPRIVTVGLADPFRGTPIDLSVVKQVSGIATSFLSPFFGYPCSVTSIEIGAIADYTGMGLCGTEPVAEEIVFSPGGVGVECSAVVRT